jgi:hypothetical protein
LLWLFWSLKNYLPGLASNLEPPNFLTSTSQLARITGMSHLYLAPVNSFKGRNLSREMGNFLLSVPPTSGRAWVVGGILATQRCLWESDKTRVEEIQILL